MECAQPGYKMTEVGIIIILDVVIPSLLFLQCIVFTLKSSWRRSWRSFAFGQLGRSRKTGWKTWNYISKNLNVFVKAIPTFRSQVMNRRLRSQGTRIHQIGVDHFPIGRWGCKWCGNLTNPEAINISTLQKNVHLKANVSVLPGGLGAPEGG